MSCFGGRVSQDLYQNCCNSNVLCEFDGDLSNVVSEPIYVQKVYDAVLVHLQGMKTVQNQSFTPSIPCGHRVKRVIDIRCRRSFNPNNVDDPTNLKLDVNTTISGATFLRNGSGEELTVVGADGNVSGNLIIAICVTCEKKIVVPVQLCVLSTGFVSVESQQNAVCTTFPTLFPKQIRPSDTLENCGEVSEETDECDPCQRPSCNPCCDPCCDPCRSDVREDSCCEPPRRPQPRR